MINLVTGGAGFIGSHLIHKLIENQENVICLDDFSSGSYKNIEKWLSNDKFKLIEHNITKPIDLKVNKIWHLACPASPSHYQNDPIETAKISFIGSYNMLNLAKNNRAKILFSSSSEIYGDATNNPQVETNKGSVNTISKRSCYVEGKRIAETLFFDFHRKFKIDIKIARIFNCYGPNMLPNDGRVISNFIWQALNNKPLTIYGNGNQTRSFCYIDDLIDGLLKFMNSNEHGPMNFGNDSEEYTINELAYIITKQINPLIKFRNYPISEDDPLKRKPVIDLANTTLKWQPKVNLSKGLEITINYFKELN